MRNNHLSADVVSKEFFRNNDTFSDLINYALYDGRQVIKAEDLIDEDTDLSASVDGESFNRNEDIIKSVHHKGSFMLCSLENQKMNDPTMLFRSMMYVALHYHKQLKRIEDKAYPQNKVYPFNLIVNFEGNEKWTCPTSIREYFKEHPLMGEVFTDFNYTVIKLSELDTNKLHNERLKTLSICLSEIYNNNIKDKERYIDYDMAKTIAGMTGYPYDLKAYFNEGDNVPMTFFEKKEAEFRNQYNEQMTFFEKKEAEFRNQYNEQKTFFEKKEAEFRNQYNKQMMLFEKKEAETKAKEQQFVEEIERLKAENEKLKKQLEMKK